MDVNKSAFILPTKIFRRIFFFLFSYRFLAKQSQPSVNWKYILPPADSQMPFDTVGTYFMYVRPPNDIASQEIYQKSNEKILKKWLSTNPHLFCQQRFSAVFFIFDFHIDLLSLASRTVTVGSCEAITTSGQLKIYSPSGRFANVVHHCID